MSAFGALAATRSPLPRPWVGRRPTPGTIPWAYAEPSDAMPGADDPSCGRLLEACVHRLSITVSAAFRPRDLERRSRRGRLEVAMMAQGYVACHGLEAASRRTSPHRHDRLGGRGGMDMAQSTPARQSSIACHVCSCADQAWRAPRCGDRASTPRLPRQGRNGATDPRRPVAGGCRRRGRDRR